MNLNKDDKSENKNEMNTSLESPLPHFTSPFEDSYANDNNISTKGNNNNNKDRLDKDKLTGFRDENEVKMTSEDKISDPAGKPPPVGKNGKKLTVNALSGRGSKYWLAGLINGVVETAFGDSAADISCYPKNKTKGMKLRQLDKPIEVSGFREKEIATITHTVDIEMHFKPGILRATFYVCDCKSIIIGSDLLQDTSKNISLITGERCLKINDFRLNTNRSESGAKKEFERRSKMTLSSYMSEFEENAGVTPLLRTRDRVYLPPHHCIDVRSYLSDRKGMKDGNHTMLSFFDHSSLDQAQDELFIPSISFKDVSIFANRTVPITNITNKGFYLPRNFVVGKIVTHACNDVMSYEIYNVNEVIEEITWRTAEDEIKPTVSDIKEKEENKEIKDKEKIKIVMGEKKEEPSNKKKQSKQSKEKENKNEDKEPSKVDRNKPAKFSDLVGVHKLDQETFDQCRTHGIDMDYKIEQIEPNVEVTEIKEPDYNAERKKAENCPYWPDREKFLKKFELSHMDNETKEKVEKLLWAYRHIWYAEEHPEQFRAGLQNVKPVKIERIPGAIPRKESLRQLSDEKLKILQRHIDDLMAQGVLVPEPSGQYASPVHLVLEERYSAAHLKNIRKARVTIDLRAVNQTIFPLAYPIPSCEEFRRHMSEFQYFSCMDGKSWFHQIRIEEASSKACFCIRACGKIFRMVRLCMGAKVSPSIAQCLVDMMFKNHENCRVYLDDLTTFSHTLEEHFQHLEKTMAYCSFYNILLSPNKAHLVTKSMRSLGMQVASKEISMCSEKIDKIKDIKFPTDKKGLVSVLAFFQYFNKVCPRLSEYTASLRRLALPSVRFKPEQHHRDDFEKAKQHLLDNRVTAIRAPSSKLDDLIYCFTDASTSAIGAVLCQEQLPDQNATEKQLYLIGTFSSVIPELWENFSIWLKELLSLFECSRKFRWLLLGRSFIVLTDSQVLTYWSNLELIPRDLARKILALQQFQFKLLFIESRANPSDVISRLSLPDMEKNRGCYEKFLENQIINSKGEIVPVESLYSERKQKEIEKFFTKTRKQQLSYAISSEEMKRRKELTAEQFLYDSKYEQEGDNCFVMDGETITVEVVDFEQEDELRKRHEDDARPTARAEIVVAAVDLDDEEQASGRVEILTDEPTRIDLPSTIELPIYEEKELEKIRNMQINDSILDQVMKYMKGEINQPSKIEAMALASEIKDFLRHKSNFRLNSQGVLMRIWIESDGKMIPLIVVSDKAFQELLSNLHNFNPRNPTSIPHMGSRRTFAALASTFYCFKMRQKVIKYVADCPVCHLDNHVTHTMREDQGEQISFEPMSLMIADYLGPLRGWATTATGQARYVFVLIDANTRYMVTIGTTDVGDDTTFSAMLQARRELCGLPKRIATDNAIFRENSAARTFLEEAGVSILHGRATISRDQSKVERAIGSLTRTICKLHTEIPTMSFERILSEATIAQNSSICRSTGKSPRELHFVRSASNFLNMTPKDVLPGKKTLKDAVQAARISSRETLMDEVRQFVKRNELTSPTQYTKRLVENDIVLKKRTSYPMGSPRKLCHKMTIDCYKVIERVASNSYKVRSLIDDKEYILPGDLLVRLRHHDEGEAIKLVKEMKKIVERNAYRSAASRAADRPLRGGRIRETSAGSICLIRRMEQVSRLGPASTTEEVFELENLFESEDVHM